jgi:hypothetical protein
MAYRLCVVLRRVVNTLASPSLRLRVGIILWAVSWMPIAELVGASSGLRLAIWSVQIVVGLVGIALCGSSFVDAVKHVGWRKAPRALWRGLIHGDVRVGAGASA